MKRYWIFGLILAMCLSLAACGQIEDTNGEDDYSLAVITHEELVKGTNSSSKIGSMRTQINDKLTVKVSKFSGVEALDSITADNSTKSITFSVQSTLESGNFFVYVRHDGQIVGELEIGKSDTLTIKQPTPGKYELCVAGESASYELSASIHKD